MMHEWSWHYWGMPMMWFIWIPVLILLAWLIFRLTGAGRPTQPPKDSPLDILKKRYASGELSTEEYEHRKKVLEKG